MLNRLMLAAIVATGTWGAFAACPQKKDKSQIGVMNDPVNASRAADTKAAGASARRVSGNPAPGKDDPLGLMKNQVTYWVKEFTGEEHQRPEMGCELSDFGSWYDVAYSGGINRFWINSVRHHTYDQVGFNTTQDVGLIALFFRTPSGELIDGSGADCGVDWYPYGWKTTTRQDGIEIESRLFFTAFNTVSIIVRVKNAGTEVANLTPSLLVTDRSDYDGMTGGMIEGTAAGDGRLAWCNRRVGKSSNPKDYTDTLLVGSTLGALRCAFLPRYLKSGRGGELKESLREKWAPALEAAAGSALASAEPFTLAPGEVREFGFYVAAGACAATAEKTAARAARDFVAAGPEGIVSRVEKDWNGYLEALPKLHDPSAEDLKLYYSAALALRTNRLILRLPEKMPPGSSSSGVPADDVEMPGQKGVLYDASCPARGGFNLFFQSDACWNVLGYLDINPDWAAGHAVPILEPPCIIMDPHYYWSMWEIYSRMPDAKKQRAFAALVYPLLQENYRVWTTQIDIDHNLLCATPNNWDDNPRDDLLFKEATDIPGQWNSWWTDWVNFSRDNYLEDPAASSQLAYGAEIMGRFARILGKDKEAADWKKQFQRHVKAIDTLWDEKKGYWIVTYRHSMKDKVLTSSILYPIFTDVCRDPARIRRVIESHILNPAEFNGPYPIPTVAYDDPRYYKQKPPRTDQEGGLWRGNIWMPEAWIIVKGLYKYGYEAEAKDIARRLVHMMSHQTQFTRGNPQFACVPAEYYDSRTGEAENIRRFSWTSAVAMDFLLGNYQNERMLGANPARDRAINGHIREIFDFESGKTLFRVKTVKQVFPLLQMTSADNLPINKSGRVEFCFSDPAGNFVGSTIFFFADPGRWSVVEKATGIVLEPDADGYYHSALGDALALIARK